MVPHFCAIRSTGLAGVALRSSSDLVCFSICRSHDAFLSLSGCHGIAVENGGIVDCLSKVDVGRMRGRFGGRSDGGCARWASDGSGAGMKRL